MTTIALAFVAIWMLVMPNRDSLRSSLAADDYEGMDCSIASMDGRRNAQETVYQSRADLDLHSSDRLIHCRQLIVPAGLRHPRIEGILQRNQGLVETTVAALASDKAWEQKIWDVIVFTQDPRLSQHVSMALRTALVGRQFKVHAGSEKNDALFSPEDWQDFCQNSELADEFAALIVFQPDIASVALQRAVCTSEGWQWL